jgi:flagellar FliL protein
MAEVVNEDLPEKKGPSLVIQLVVLLVMTGAAVGIGWFSGSLLGSEAPPAMAGEEAAPAEPTAHGADAGHGGGHGESKGDEEEEQGAVSINPLVLNLPPITTNLAAPSDTWLRLELSIELDAPTEDLTLADTIQQDLLAFMRTVKLHQIEGASGFQHLKADLAERAAIRSKGHVKAVLVRSLLFE